MIENGSSGEARPLPPIESHDEFLELCALATTGSLSAEERRRLREHLPTCPDCRETITQYETVIAKAIPPLASDLTSLDPTDNSAHWSLEEAEASLFARLKREEVAAEIDAGKETPPAPKSPQLFQIKTSPADTLWRHVWWQYAAGLLLVAALGVSVYRIGIRRGAETAARYSPLQVLPSSQPSVISHPDQPANRVNAASDPTHRNEKEMSELRVQLDDRSAEISRLKAQQAQLEKDLSDKEADRSRLVQDRADVARQLELAQANLQVIQQKLDSATGQGSQDAARMLALQERITELTTSLHERDQEVAREQELLEHDRDIRNLMGSRDLYIAEVYDVAKTGDTQKAFGRVFYTKGKSLIFYAYDLDQQRGIQTASSFQAWGRRGPEREHAVNLGIFYQDNANTKRWVLKSNDPKTLAQIDAVFVTVEPNGGSSHPSGKSLLFAYLRIEPNHP
jgi:anti-sigma factor RsiW